MQSDSEGEQDRKKRRRRASAKADVIPDGGRSGGGADKYKPYLKNNYKRIYPDKSNHDEFAVFLVSNSEEKLGNKDPITIQKMLSTYIKGQYEMSRVNARKLKISFKQATDANDLLGNEALFRKCDIRAFIPSSFVEKVGVIHHVSTELSNEELFRKLSGENEIVAVRRFMKRVDGILEPLKTVTVTFVTDILPQCIYLDHWRMPVKQYIPPVMQCYRCMKFNHAAAICRNKQVCSRCSAEHSYKECTEEILKCVNCGGDHLAISKDCPVKVMKIENQKKSYANVVSMDKKNFPALASPSRPSPSVTPRAAPSAATVTARPPRANTA